MDYKNSLGNRIRELRGKMSLRDFADVMDISHTYLNNLEKGLDPRTQKPVNVTVDVLIRIATKLNIDPHYLLDLAITDNVLTDEEQPESIYGNHKDNLAYFADKPELLEIYREIYESESLQLLFDSAKDLTPEALETVLQVIKSIKGGNQ